jgi:branched-chain amino acid transport system permease protein
MERYIALLSSGIAQGALYAVAAVGFLLLYNATGIINFAQGDLVTLGAYVAIWGVTDLGLPVAIAYVLSLTVLFVFGMVLERVTYAPLRNRPMVEVLIATLGAGIIIRTAIAIWQGSTPQALESLVAGRTITIGGAIVSMQRIVIVGVTIVVVAGLILMFQNTQFGRQLRAIAANREAAQLQGIRTRRLSLLVWGMSASLAALCGILIGPLGAVDLNLGFTVMLGGFAAAVLGGFGSLKGVVLAGLGLGIIEHFVGGLLIPNYKEMLPFVLMILVIAWKPQGLVAAQGGSRL